MRAFLAVPLQEPAVGEVRQLLRRLRQSVSGVRWVRDDALHITLHFFGQLDERAAGDALRAVQPVVERSEPFPLTLDQLGAFPSRGTARVLWAGCSTTPFQLQALFSGCVAALRDAGFTVESRPYRPHCTLGRPRDGWPEEGRRSWSSLAASGVVNTTFTASSVVLYDSHLQPEGAVHVPLHRLQLGSRPRPVA